MFAGMALLSERVTRFALRSRGWRSRSVATSTGRVHWLESEGGGTLPPTVFLHGYNSAGSYNYPLLTAVRPHVKRVFSPDLPAHGFSSTPTVSDGHRLFDGLRDALDRALDGHEPVAIVGNSMGAALALRYAVHQPSRVRGLVLVAPGGAPMSGEELAALQTLFAVRTVADAGALIDRLLVRPTALRPLYAASLRQAFRRPAQRQLLERLDASQFLRPDELRAVQAPTLVLWGAEERVLPRSGLAFFREHLPAGARVEVVGGVGHSPQIDDLPGTVERILGFLRTL